MSYDGDKSRNNAGDTVLSAQGTSELDLMRKILEQLQSNNEFLRENFERERDHRKRLEEILNSEREQWKDEREQWKDEREQWKGEREHFSEKISDLENKVKDLGLLLKREMGIVPSSETLHSFSPADDSSCDGNGSDDDSKGAPAKKIFSNQEEKYRNIKNRDRGQVRNPDGLSWQELWVQLGSDLELIRPPATIFSSEIFAKQHEKLDFSFSDEEKQLLFGKKRGLHSKKDSAKIYDIELTVNEIQCHYETLSDAVSGLSHRKSNSRAPPGAQMSWASIAKLSILIAEFAFPMERLSRCIGMDYFSSSNISRWFIKTAHMLQPIYIALGQDLGHKGFYLRTDDTSCLVLDLRREAKTKGLTPDCHHSTEEWEDYLDNLSGKNEQPGKVDLVRDVVEAFGRVSESKSSGKAKTGLNTTIVSGKLNPQDYSSMVYFYRTHFGQAGNLLTKLLESRRSKDKRKIVIQCDMSSQNHLSEEVEKRLDVTYAGCMSHARRPFKRHSENDPDLCFYMLRGFAALAHLEETIKNGPLTSERILGIRGKYGVKIWNLLKKRCQDIIDGNQQQNATRCWKKGDKLYTACAYIINHFSALTYYLSHPHISADNNLSEQGLRGEKLIENAALFRVVENGRIALDIHRTLIATCNAAGTTYEAYLSKIGNLDLEEIRKDPQRFFPHVIDAKDEEEEELQEPDLIVH